MIEKKTRGQAKNPRWKAEREWRLTASSFGEICKMTEKRDTQKLAQNLFNSGRFSCYIVFINDNEPNQAISSDYFDHPAIRHGNTHEETAREKFAALTGKTVLQCGLFVHPTFPFLGASPGV